MTKTVVGLVLAVVFWGATRLSWHQYAPPVESERILTLESKLRKGPRAKALVPQSETARDAGNEDLDMEDALGALVTLEGKFVLDEIDLQMDPMRENAEEWFDTVFSELIYLAKGAGVEESELLWRLQKFYTLAEIGKYGFKDLDWLKTEIDVMKSSLNLEPRPAEH